MTKRATAPAAVWSESIGLLPHRVIVEEIPARQSGIYLRWWNADKGNWEKRSLKNNKLGKPLRDDRGRLIDETVKWATDLAHLKYVELTGGIEPKVKTVTRPFTIGETWLAISDVARGKYPHKSDFRDEVERALTFACTVWGKDRAWETIGDEDWASLMRQRVTELVARGNVGVRATEITVSRLITTAKWLRKTKRIPPGTAESPDKWKADLVVFWKGLTQNTRDPVPNRPRFEHDVALKILAVTWNVDPRFGLLMDLGAELRLGQVARCRRSDLDLEKGVLLVRGAGKKGGTTVDLTSGQMASVQAALGGYLKDRERAWLAERTDYDLFPGGRTRRWRVKETQVPTSWRGKARPIAGDTIRRWFREAEAMVKLEDGSPLKHVKGRGAYGIRRVHVDVANAEGISRLGLRAAGGWSSTKIPDEVYAEQENMLGRAEAKVIRARFRREPEPEKADATQATTSTTVHTSSTLSENTVDGTSKQGAL